MKELNQEQLLSVAGAGLAAAGNLFSGMLFDITTVMISNISRGSEDIIFADHQDISRLRYEVI